MRVCLGTYLSLCTHVRPAAARSKVEEQRDELAMLEDAEMEAIQAMQDEGVLAHA